MWGTKQFKSDAYASFALRHSSQFHLDGVCPALKSASSFALLKESRAAAVESGNGCSICIFNDQGLSYLPHKLNGAKFKKMVRFNVAPEDIIPPWFEVQTQWPQSCPCVFVVTTRGTLWCSAAKKMHTHDCLRTDSCICILDTGELFPSQRQRRHPQYFVTQKHIMRGFGPQPLRTTGDVGLKEIGFRTRRFVWRTATDEYLVGPCLIFRKQLKIRYGLENGAFWRMAMQNWCKTFLMPFMPFKAASAEDLASKLKAAALKYGMDSYNAFKETMEVFDLDLEICAKWPLGAELFVHYAFQTSDHDKETPNVWNTNHLKSYIRLTNEMKSPEFVGDLTLLQRLQPFISFEEMLDLFDYLSTEDIQIHKWYAAFACAFSDPVAMEALHSHLVPILSSNFMVYHQTIVALAALKNADPENPKFINDPSYRPKLLFCRSRYPSLQKRFAEFFQKLNKDSANVKWDCMDYFALSNSHVMISTWKWFEDYMKECSAHAYPVQSNHKLEFSLGNCLTQSAVASLVNYFYTGDPDITSYVDALLILEMAQELRFCDSNKIPLPGHESLIYQLIFTLQTGRIESNDLFFGLCAAKAQGIPELEKEIESRLRLCFNQESQSYAARWFSKLFPMEFNALAQPIDEKKPKSLPAKIFSSFTKLFPNHSK